MLPTTLWLLCLSAIEARAQSSTSRTDTTAATGTESNAFYTGSFSTLSSIPTSNFAGSQYTYLTETGQSSADTSTLSGAANATGTSSSGDSQITVSTTSHSLTILGGLTTSSNATASSTSSAAGPSNTIPCNGYPEFCNRQYSNITEVCAHNSAFVIKNNAASNQALPIGDQLNDGVRMLQGETHYVNDTIYNCHSSCTLLNAGTWQSSLEYVASWLRDHPYDVVTWLIVNSDFVNVDKYVPAIQNSGLAQYLYEPAYIPQRRDQWPTLGEMILSGKRMVLFMDYNANQTAVPYILDEFSHIWETPFSPTNQSFPCTQQRPPNLNQTRAKEEYMYLANHNLNTAIDVSAILGGTSTTPILIPNTAEINQTNGEYNSYGQLGAMNDNCTNDWDRPPNFLLVDYYNYGDPDPGSVFEVAARANGVTYNRKCCGLNVSAAPTVRGSLTALAVALMFAVLLAW